MVGTSDPEFIAWRTYTHCGHPTSTVFTLILRPPYSGATSLSSLNINNVLTTCLFVYLHLKARVISARVSRKAVF